jgi:hypothetical protein
MKKIYKVLSVWGADEKCRVTTDSVGIPVTIVNLVIWSFVLELTTCKRYKLHTSTTVRREARTSGRIDDQQERCHERKEDNRRAENCPSGPSFDQGCD